MESFYVTLRTVTVSFAKGALDGGAGRDDGPMDSRFDYVAPEVVLDWVRSHPLPDGRIIPVCVWGERGVGKTMAVRAYTQQRELGFRGYHPAHDRSGADIVGLAMLDEVLERTVYARPLWLPGENDPVVFERRGVLFIDELNRAPSAVLQGLMEPLGEGTIEHSGWRLPAGWGFVCACNPPEPGYDVVGLDESLMSRMVHVPMGFDAVRWAAWAGNADVHPHLVSFSVEQPELLASAQRRLPDGVKVTPTPRSVEYLSRLYEPEMPAELLWTLARGLLGVGAAEAFFAHLRASEHAITAEEVFAGQWQSHLSALVSGRRGDLIDASERLLLAALVRYRPSEDAADRCVDFIAALGERRTQRLWQRIQENAPAWTGPLIDATRRRQHNQ
jgi:hypothetical protein